MTAEPDLLNVGSEVKPERLEELGHFVEALMEWGVQDPHAMADEIKKFLTSDFGIIAYRDVYEDGNDTKH